MINSATMYCEREADDHLSVGRSQKISANAVMTITLSAVAACQVMTQLPTGRGTKTAFRVEAPSRPPRSRMKWRRHRDRDGVGHSGPSITINVDGPMRTRRPDRGTKLGSPARHPVRSAGRSPTSDHI
jgi:hypothetical protein